MDIAEGMRKAVLPGSFPAAICFDFAAAVPSLANGYLMKTLEEIGLPSLYRRATAALYDAHSGKINSGGKGKGCINIETGIRQGCPLSPLLFALVGGFLIRKLCRHVSGCLCKSLC